MKLRSLPLGLLLSCALLSPAFAGHGQNFTFDDESFRIPPENPDPNISTTGVHLADVDGDGDLDLFLAEGSAGPQGYPNRLLINDGHGNFSDQSATRLPPNAANSNRSDFGDIDGDGDLDLIVANLGPEQLLVNNGNGFFTDASATQLPPPVGLFSNISPDVRFADVDGDGAPDILVSNENPFDPDPLHGGQNRIFMNDGAGSFTDETAARLPAITDQTAGMVPGDIDGDGDLDIVVANRGQERVLINDGLGFFADQTAARFPVTSDSTRQLALADFDGDGDLDAITANSRAQPTRIYFNNGSGVFTEGTFSNKPVVSETNTDLEVVDLEGDGDLDVYITNAGQFVNGHGFTGGQSHYFRNNGHGQFSDKTKLHFPDIDDPATDAAFGDLDGDGDLDLVVGNSGAPERLYLQHDKP